MLVRHDLGTAALVLAIAGCVGGPERFARLQDAAADAGVEAGAHDGDGDGAPDQLRDAQADAADAESACSEIVCEEDPEFPERIPLPEGSAATEIEITPGQRQLVVAADSTNQGAIVLWDIPAGPFYGSSLEIDDGASDDVEGMSWRCGELFTLTASGGLRHYRPDEGGNLALEVPAYPIGEVPVVCPDLHDSDCVNDFEGLCLRGACESVHHCVGYAASKTISALYCLVERDGRLAVDMDWPLLALDVPAGTLSDCAFGTSGGVAQDHLLVTTNFFGGSVTYCVDEASGELDALPIEGLTSNGAVVLDRDGAVYLFEDDQLNTSGSSRSTCVGF